MTLFALKKKCLKNNLKIELFCGNKSNCNILLTKFCLFQIFFLISILVYYYINFISFSQRNMMNIDYYIYLSIWDLTYSNIFRISRCCSLLGCSFSVQQTLQVWKWFCQCKNNCNLKWWYEWLIIPLYSWFHNLLTKKHGRQNVPLHAFGI